MNSRLQQHEVRLRGLPSFVRGTAVWRQSAHLAAREGTRTMSESVTIGIIGDYDGRFRAHVATNDALRHAADDRSLPLCVRWLPTEDLAGADGEEVLARCDGLWAAPGSPY